MPYRPDRPGRPWASSRPDRPGPTSTAPQPGERDRSGGPEAAIDPHTGRERPGIEPSVRQVDGTYGGLAPPEANESGGRDSPPRHDGPRAYVKEDHDGSSGSTVESGSGRADRM